METDYQRGMSLALYAAEALLREAERLPCLEQFLTNTCPKFQHYRADLELDLQLTVAHKYTASLIVGALSLHSEFVSLLECHVLEKTALSTEKLLQSSGDLLEQRDPIVIRLVQCATEYSDFHFFANMVSPHPDDELPSVLPRCRSCVTSGMA